MQKRMLRKDSWHWCLSAAQICIWAFDNSFHRVLVYVYLDWICTKHYKVTIYDETTVSILTSLLSSQPNKLYYNVLSCKISIWDPQATDEKTLDCLSGIKIGLETWALGRYSPRQRIYNGSLLWCKLLRGLVVDFSLTHTTEAHNPAHNPLRILSRLTHLLKYRLSTLT